MCLIYFQHSILQSNHFCVFILCYNIFLSVFLFFCVMFSFFQYHDKWLAGRTFLKWRIFCRMGCKTLISQLKNKSVYINIFDSNTVLQWWRLCFWRSNLLIILTSAFSSVVLLIVPLSVCFDVCFCFFPFAFGTYCCVCCNALWSLPFWCLFLF